MRVLFSDEAGINNDEDAPNVVVAAVMLSLDSHWPVLAQEIERIIRTQDHDPARYEIKGSSLIKDLRRAKRDPTERNLKFEQRSSLIWAGCLLQLLKQSVPVFISAVNKSGYAWIQSQGKLFAGISAYMAAFSQCLREADNYIHSSSPKERLLWISDKAQMHESDLKEALRSIREIQQTDLRKQFPKLEFSGPRFSNIADTIYFGDSKHSRALQLADLCATTASLHLQSEPLAVPFFRMLGPQIKSGFVAPLFLGMDKMSQRYSSHLKRSP